MGVDPKTLSTKLQRQIAAAQGLIAPEGTKVYTFMSDQAYGEDYASKPFTGPESVLQRDCEEWMKHRGYWPRDYKHLEAGSPSSGWYIHIRKAQGNPIVLDLLILRVDGRYLEVELKKDKGVISKHQQILLNGGGYIARSFVEFTDIFEQWEERMFQCQ